MARSKTATGGVWWWVDGTPSPTLERLQADPDGVLRGPGSVARARVGRKRFYRLDAGPGDPALYVKVFQVRPGGARWRSLLRPSKARREARIAARVLERGFAVAAPVAVGEERRLGFLIRSFSVVPERAARDLQTILEDPATCPARRRSLVESFARLNRALHDAGIDQDDTSPNNFLVDDHEGWTLIDFERCRVGAPLRDRRFTLLAKLHRKDLGLSRSDRLRFLASYLGPDSTPGDRRAAWQRIERAFVRIRRRDARRAAAGAFREGRHVGRDGEVWFIRGREDVATLRLDLSPEQARAGWVTAQQLERLGLPALRPVRLDGTRLDLQAPEAGDTGRHREAAIARARRRLCRHGRFVTEPDWESTPSGAVLRDPTAFEVGA